MAHRTHHPKPQLRRLRHCRTRTPSSRHWLQCSPQIRPQKYPIPKLHYLPHPCTRPSYDAKRHPDPIRLFPQCTGQTDRRTDAPTDRQWETLITIGRCAPRATRPNNFNRLSPFIQENRRTDAQTHSRQPENNASTTYGGRRY